MNEPVSAGHTAAISSSIYPQVPHGLCYPTWVKGLDVYTACGWFRPDAPQRDLPHLVRAPCLVLDMDLADYFVHCLKGDPQHAAWLGSASRVEARAWAKSMVRALLDDALLEWRRAHYAAATAAVAAVLGELPSRITSSGWGLHATVWLDARQGYTESALNAAACDGDDMSSFDCEATAEVARSVNADLVRAVNAVAGFELADKGIHDAGTRLLREVGSVNYKCADRPQQVRLLKVGNECFDLKAIAVRVARPAHQPPTPGATAAPAEGRGPAAPVEGTPPQEVDFSTVLLDDGRTLQDVADSLVPGTERDRENVTCPWGGSSRGSAFVCALDDGRTYLRSNALGCTVWNSRGVAELACDDKGRPWSDITNLGRLVRNDSFFDALWYHERNRVVMWGDRQFRDPVDLFAMREHIANNYKGFRYAKEDLRDCLISVATAERGRNLLTEWLDSLEWDGVERAPTWLSRTAGCADTVLHRAYSSKTLISAVARAYDPGCKVDTVLTLRGEQGIGKQRLFRALAGGEYFSDSMLDLKSKDAEVALACAWFWEFAELASVRRADMDTVKAFITRRDATYRPSYGRGAETFKRHTIFVASTNDQLPLIDPTGARRWWVVQCQDEEFDLTWLEANRDQLWAEAVHRYRAGEPWYLDDPHLKELQRCASESFELDNPEQDLLAEWTSTKQPGSRVTLDHVLTTVLEVPKERLNKHRYSAGPMLLALGWEKKRIRVKGARLTVYELPGGPSAT